VSLNLAEDRQESSHPGRSITGRLWALKPCVLIPKPCLLSHYCVTTCHTLTEVSLYSAGGAFLFIVLTRDVQRFIRIAKPNLMSSLRRPQNFRRSMASGQPTFDAESCINSDKHGKKWHDRPHQEYPTVRVRHELVQSLLAEQAQGPCHWSLMCQLIRRPEVICPSAWLLP